MTSSAADDRADKSSKKELDSGTRVYDSGSTERGAGESSSELRRKIGLAAVKRLIILGIVLGASLAISTNAWPALTLDRGYLLYIQITEVTIVGYFAIEVISKAGYKLAYRHSEQLAKKVASLNRTLGAIVVIAVIISYLSRDPVVAVSIGTVSGIVVGFASQNIIGNLIAGMYLVIARPFHIGDRIRVFDK